MSATPMLLEVDKLEVQYSRARALFGVSLSLAPGTVRAVLGANGAGKSSLAGAIAGVVQPVAGHVRFDGTTSRDGHRTALHGSAWRTCRNSEASSPG